MEGSDLCYEIVKRALLGFVYSEAVAREMNRDSSLHLFGDGLVTVFLDHCKTFEDDGVL
ncbi:hypothetical protein CEXT_308741, partial [Caerostris extrusa]